MRVPTVLEVVFLKGRWPLYRHGADPPQKLPYRHAVCGSPCLSLLWPFSSSQYFFKGCFFPRARVRGQVVAVGPQSIAGRAFDVAVIELYGDAPQGEGSTRLDGALVVDRGSGLVLRLDLRSAQPLYQLQRRLVRVESAG